MLNFSKYKEKSQQKYVILWTSWVFPRIWDKAVFSGAVCHLCLVFTSVTVYISLLPDLNPAISTAVAGDLYPKEL
jgi:hypothetical protein